MEGYLCYHCKGPFGDLGDLINHTRDEHQARQLSNLVPDKQNFRAYHYNKHPTDIPKNANIYFEGGKLIVKEKCVSDSPSSTHKIAKQAVTPVKRPIDAKAELFVQYSDLSETLEYSDAHSASDIAPSDI